MTAAHEASRMVAEVRDDPGARIRLAGDTYALRGARRPFRAYRRAVVAFMRWQQSRGVLNALDAAAPGSPWWRAVNEDLLRDALEAKLLVEREDVVASRPTVQHWVDFFRAPSARSWYLAHNASVVAGYLAHAELAEREGLAERFFMNVVLVRVLYAHALVFDANLALGRFAPLATLVGHPRARGPQALLSMKDVLPVSYPIKDVTIEEIIDSENRVFRMVDVGVIAPRAEALYAMSARALGEPRLRWLVDDGGPAYAWPAEHRHVWRPARTPWLHRVVDAVTRPRRAPLRGQGAVVPTSERLCRSTTTADTNVSDSVAPSLARSHIPPRPVR
ncbi:hypothetical protein [Mycobacterium sp. 29Ha]|uniref:hypothetical protein n=1 Tax=Mycobacterium sp. 29Ha TaxID=2939268 RepID=UPI0029393385|nr:hypothetical protein [Mycobacterium sp. 29Ha]MDV3135577.1 hypothetical protein [Mycobacterium sp. 29Ha]